MTTTPISRTRTFTWHDPQITAGVARTMDGLAFLEAIAAGEVPPPPIMALLGAQIDTVERGRVVFSFEPAEFHYNPIGSVHGGVITTYCDSAMGCALQSELSAGTGYTTLELKLNFLRPLTIASGRAFCEGRVISHGGRTALTEARLSDAAGRLYAHATSTCLIFRPERGGAQ